MMFDIFSSALFYSSANKIKAINMIKISRAGVSSQDKNKNSQSAVIMTMEAAFFGYSRRYKESLSTQEKFMQESNDTNELVIQPLTMPPLLQEVIHDLPKAGKIKIRPDFFSYLDIDDNFIHRIYPLLEAVKIKADKPDYFSKKTDYIGAHISLTYPEENTQLHADEENKLIVFDVVGLFTAYLGDKRYFALKVNAPELGKIRHKYGLGDKLQLYGQHVDPHITIATTKKILIVYKI